MTKIDKPLRREVEIASRLYTLVVDREGVKLKRKGRRRGMAVAWAELAGRLDRTLESPPAPGC